MKRICFVINNRANYARIKTAIRECVKRSDLDVHIIVGASALLYRFGNVSEIIEKDGFSISYKLLTLVEGDEPTSMAKTTGLSMLSLADALHKLKPDIVVTVADRYETIATAVTASYMNILVAHTQGGEVTGSIDDNVRHAITKLSHIHFPATKEASKILVQLGEDQGTIFNVGCPSIDLAKEAPVESPSEVLNKYHGVGTILDYSKPYLLVSQHPDTLEFKNARDQITETIEAVRQSQMQVIWLWPNVDSGSDSISKRIREFRENTPNNLFRFYRNFEAVDYINILRNSSCIVGNSSSGIREASYLGIPSVNIGERQRGRQKLRNVIDVSYSRTPILQAIRKQIGQKSFSPDDTYGHGNAGLRIAEILASGNFSLKKTAISQL